MGIPAIQIGVKAACALCDLPLPDKPVTGDSGKNFCCPGCLHVATILEAVGSESTEGRKALDAARQHGLISATPTPRKTTGLPDAVREENTLRVAGMVCPSCAWLVESVIESCPGVAHAEVDYLCDTASIVFDLSKTSLDEISDSVAKAGYGLANFSETGGKEERRELMRLAVAAAIALNLMMLAWIGYDVFFPSAIDPVSGFLGWVQVVLAVPVIAWSALPIYRRALAAARNGRVVMETLLSIGILSASSLSVYSLVAGKSHLFLETATMLVALSLGGRALERFLKKKTAASLTKLMHFSPTKAREADSGRFAPLTEFSVGDRVRVDEGETVPLDIRSESEVIVREGLLTGEPHPVRKLPGEIVLAGSQVEKDILLGRVEQAAGETVADGIRKRVAEALRKTDTGSRLADRLAQGFVPLVILTAVAALAGHVINGLPLENAVLIAVSVLVIACPCAFGVAASSAHSLSLLRLARSGILVKDSLVLETASKINLAIFDKTGTVTSGRSSVVQIGWIEKIDRWLLDAVRSLEKHSKHPIGIAISRLVGKPSQLEAEGVLEIPGMGITGTIEDRRIAVGRAELFAALEKDIPDQQESVTRIYFGLAGEMPSGWIDIADSVRPEAASVMKSLHRSDIETYLLSGDSQMPVDTVATEVGIEYAKGGLRPEQKAHRVKELIKEGKIVAYIGDGFNDAEALAEASIGIALASGADLALISAPVVITGNDLGSVPHFFAKARYAHKVLRGNFAWAFLYNMAFVPLAAFGFLAPIYAAALMAISSASVALNSMRLRGKRNTRDLH